MDTRQDPPVVTGPSRRLLAALASLNAAVVAVLAARYTGFEGPGRMDTLLGGYLSERLSGQRGVLRWVVVLLGPPTVVAVALLMSLLAWQRHRARLAVLALAGPLLTGASTSALQPLVGRTLDGGFALPSGHTAGVTAVATVAALLVIEAAGRARRWVVVLAVAAVPAVGGAMAVALVTNGLHVPTDTVAGFCTAVAVVLGLGLAIDGVAGLRSPRAPARGD